VLTTPTHADHPVTLHLWSGLVIGLAFVPPDFATEYAVAAQWGFGYDAPGVAFVDVGDINIVVIINSDLLHPNLLMLIVEHLFGGVSLPNGHTDEEVLVYG
jgi:hypothetical protein